MHILKYLRYGDGIVPDWNYKMCVGIVFLWATEGKTAEISSEIIQDLAIL